MIINFDKIGSGSGSGGGSGMSTDQELVISMALNDLNDRLVEVENNQA